MRDIKIDWIKLWVELASQKGGEWGGGAKLIVPQKGESIIKLNFIFQQKSKWEEQIWFCGSKIGKKEIKCRSKNKQSIITLTHTNALRGKRDRLLVEGVGWEKQLPESIDCYIGHWKNGGSEDIFFRSSPIKTGLVLTILLIKWVEIWFKMMSWSEKNICIIFNYLIVHSSSAMQLSIEWMIFFSQYFLMLIHQWWFR